MTPHTRRKGPIPAFDLDPWQSNSNRFPAAPPPRQVRRAAHPPVVTAPPPRTPVCRVARSPTLSTLSSLSPLPEEMTDRALPGRIRRQPRTESAPQSAHISPVNSTHSVHSAANQSAAPPEEQQPNPPRTPEIDDDALFRRFNHQLSIVPTSRTTLEPASKVKQPWEFRVKEFASANHLKWDGSNYVSWRKVQLVVLRTYKWIGHAEGTSHPPQDVLSSEYDLWQTVDNLTVSQICMNMDFDLYGELAEGLETAAELWRAIEKRFSQKTAAARSTAKLNLDNKKIQPGDAMKQHITDLRKLKAQYLNCGGKMDEADWHTTVLNSLSDHEQWKTLTVFGHSHPHPDSLIAFLEDQDARGFAKTSRTENALQSRPNPRFRPRVRNNFVCSNCEKLGHTLNDCWAPGGGASHKRPASYRVPQHMLERERAQLTAQIAVLERQRAQLATGGDTYRESMQREDSIQHRLGDAAMVAGERGVSRTSWVYDTGASSHMTNDVANFASYEKISPIVVATADDRTDSPLLAIGRGTVMGRFHYGNETVVVPMKDVLYVPNLSQNLVSYIQMDRNGVETRSSGGTIHFILRGVAYAKAIVKGKQVIMQMDVAAENANLTSSKESIQQPLHVWHQRLAHLNQSRVEELARKKLAVGIELSTTNRERCEACVMSKMAATPARPREIRASQLGDIVHADIEYMLTKSFSGAIYSLKFLDEFANYLWCHAVIDKSAVTVLQHWKDLVASLKTQTGVTVKTLHTDNGTEFVNSMMEEFNRNNGITHHLTVPFRHEMNGRIERMNRTGADAVRTMLHMAGLPGEYWAEAYNTFAYLHNRSGTSQNGDVTPHQVLFGSKPSVDHVRMFGATAYVHAVPEKRKKLDPKATKMILVGYRDNAAYRLIDPISKNVTYSRDVIFDELRSFRVTDLHAGNGNSNNDVPDSHATTNPLASTPVLRSSTRPRVMTERAKQSAKQEQDLAFLDRRPNRQERVFTSIVGEIAIPNSVKQALASPQAQQWHAAMSYEISKLNEMDVWDVVERPEGTHVIAGRWVYAVKEQADGTVDYRARWVARGDSQVPGLEFNETFAASGDFISARLVFALSCQPDADLVTLDISSAYLHSPLSEADLVVEYPTGFCVPGFSSPCCKLKKALYGLRQGARAWSDHFSDKLATLGFVKCISAPTVFVRTDGEGGKTIMATHVDDSSSYHLSKSPSGPNTPTSFKQELGQYFTFKEKKPEAGVNVLGITIKRESGSVKLSLAQKINRSLERYGMQDANYARTPMDQNALAIFANDPCPVEENPPWPYAQLVGELLWFSTILRLDIAFAANLLARYLQKPTKTHWNAALRVLRYLAKTKDLGIVYEVEKSMELKAYSDSDWAGDVTDRKSIGGYVFMYAGAPIAWKSRKQTVVAKSTAEAEYLAVSACAQEAVWFAHLFNELGISNGNPMDVHVDNHAAILMTKNPVYLSKTKHIDIHAHHIRDEVAKGRIRLVKVDGADNPADILTKPLGPIIHERCLELLGMK